MTELESEEISFDAPPNCNGWSWKQVVMGGLLSIAMAINRVANAIDSAQTTAYLDRPE